MVWRELASGKMAEKLNGLTDKILWKILNKEYEINKIYIRMKMHFGEILGFYFQEYSGK